MARERVVFKSIEHSDRMYSFNPGNEDSGFYRAPGSFLHKNAFRFDTFGDGATQHSPEYSVSRDDCIDYWGSFAYHLRENSECIASLEYNWSNTISRRDVLFCAGLKWKEGKTVYYNKGEYKTSKAESKRYDKRWEQVPEWADGSVESIHRLLAKSYWCFTDSFRAIGKIRHMLMEMDGPYWFDFEKWYGNKDWHLAEQVLDTIQCFVDSYNYRKQADSALSCLDNNWLRNKLGIGKEEEVVNG